MSTSARSAAVVFHSTLSEDLSDAFERLQRVALKSIFDLSKSYTECLALSGLQLLSERRTELFLDFAKKTAESPLYGPVWFPQKEKSTYNLRREETYAQEFVLRERLQKAPIYAMRTALNIAT